MEIYKYVFNHAWYFANSAPGKATTAGMSAPEIETTEQGSNSVIYQAITKAWEYCGEEKATP